MPEAEPAERRIGRIPIRNLWFLMLYASELTRTSGVMQALTDRDINDIPDLIAHLLAQAVQQRLRQPLTAGQRREDSALPRVRGRIRMLETYTRQLPSRGQVFCSHEVLTLDTPRNRLVRAALERLACRVDDHDRKQQCRTLAATLARAGVAGPPPSAAELAADPIGRNDSTDSLLVALARLAFERALPTEEPGREALPAPEREEAWVRRLFEKAVLGFARVELGPAGYEVRGEVPLRWQVDSASAALRQILPRMVTDIVIDSPAGGPRLVIDTKLTSVLAFNRFGQEGLRSEHLYQMYAYLRSQEGSGVGDAARAASHDHDRRWDTAAGLLLHPATGLAVREHVVLQGHRMSFATVDLYRSPVEIRQELRAILSPDFWMAGQCH